MRHFASLATSSGGARDGNLVTDEEKWISGTNPNDPASIFAATFDNHSPASVEVSFPGIPERRYVLETSTDLIQWENAGTMDSLSASGLQTLLLDTPQNEHARFFRVRVSLE